MPGTILDVFEGDLFGAISLTEGINKIPYQPTRAVGIFATEAVFTEDVAIEEKHGKLTLVPTNARGSMPEFDTEAVRLGRKYAVPHLPKNNRIMASDLEGVRSFNSADRLEGVNEKVADMLASIQADHATTWEWHAIHALTTGVVLDADGSTTIYDWNTEFGITPSAAPISLTAAATDVDSPKLACHLARRQIMDSLGGENITGISAFCNAAFMDQFTTHPLVTADHNRWRETQVSRDNQAYNFVDLYDIHFEEYRGSIGGVSFVDDPTGNDLPIAYAYPTGTRNIFKRYNAPSPQIPFINTRGRDIYVEQMLNKWRTAIEFYSNSNPMFINQRPQCITRMAIVA